ncbi:SixA phosphatase family protein [Profundibacter sp.]
MTLRLILTRHAKSSWDDPTLDDHDRALNARGNMAAKAIAKWLEENDYCPQAVYLSTARRTSQTWAHIAKNCRRADEVQFTSALYLASPDRMLTILQGSRRNSVMMLGHNPGTGMLAAALVKTPPIHPKFDQYPSAATTVIEFEAESWADITRHSGRVEAFIVPRDLTD